jgi:transposase IS66-like protein
LFFGDANAGQRSAIIYSIIESCRRHGVEPYTYLREVLTRLPSMTNRQIKDQTRDIQGCLNVVNVVTPNLRRFQFLPVKKSRDNSKTFRVTLTRERRVRAETYSLRMRVRA